MTTYSERHFRNIQIINRSVKVIVMSVHLSPSPGGREYEIRTTDILSSDYEASQPQDGNYRTDIIVHESSESQKSSTEPSSMSQAAKDTPAIPIHPQPHNHCTAPTDPSPTSPHRQHCSTDTPSASATQNTSSFNSATPATTHQGLCQAPSSPERLPQPGPLSVQTPHPSEAASLPPAVAQEVSQPQSQTQTQASGMTRSTPAQVIPSSPTREPHPETPKPTTPTHSATSAPASPTPAAPSSPQHMSSSMEGSPVSDAPVPGFATLGRKLMLGGSDPHHPNHIQQQAPPHHHYPGMEHSAAGQNPTQDTSKRPCYSAHTPQLHPSSYSNYSTISIPLPHPQPPLPEKRHPPAHPGSPNDGVGTLRPAVGHVPPSTNNTAQHQHHVTFSPTVGEIAPPAGQNDGEASVEAENANRVSVKFVQDSSRFWYKPGISREQGRSKKIITLYLL